MSDHACIVCGRHMPRHRRAKKAHCSRRCAGVAKWAVRQARIKADQNNRRGGGS